MALIRLKILFLTPYPLSAAPSQRFRFEQYFCETRKQGFTIKLQSFLDEHTWQILYYPNKTTEKAWGIVKGFLRRFTIFLTLYKYDFVFIHREASPIGPPIFEWLISQVFRKKIIYDFDDAIWIPNISENNRIAAATKWHHKVSSICKWSYKVSAGSSYLAEYARQFNSNVVVNPTAIDTENVHNVVKEHLPSSVKLIIGWTGSHSTLQYLNEIIPALKKLEEIYIFEFVVIANKDPRLPLKSFRFMKWNKETEIEDLSTFDIGLMPLVNDPWAKGKCGFKALQYMALGIPPLDSPVGVNTEIVKDGVNGFICKNEQDWLDRIKQLIEDVDLRRRIAVEARRTVEGSYSVHSNTTNFLSLFQ